MKLYLCLKTMKMNFGVEVNMTNIVDRRKSGKNKSVGNRQKFLKRYKHKIKGNVDRIADSKGITDTLKDRQVTINTDDIDEPNFNFDITTGERDIVLPGNKNRQKGDKIKRDYETEPSGGSPEGELLDEFTFTLTKEEFLDLYFSDMCLPDFIKESLKGAQKHKWKRTGYSKEGIPPRLDLVKTLKQALARRMATKKVCEYCLYAPLKKCKKCGGMGYSGKQRFLDDIDLRYKHFTKQPYPIKQATMILLMDTSGSMGEYEKNIAKKFFLLLYLFLNKVYKTVNVIFISHTTEAKEVTEDEFFYSQESGGTIVSSGLQLAKNIINERIDLNTTNVYISQASDGDNWKEDDAVSASLVEELLEQVQYFAYIQIESPDTFIWKRRHKVEDLIHIYREVSERYKNLQCRSISHEREVYTVLRELFERKL